MRIYTIILTAFAVLAVTACSATPPANQTATSAVNLTNQTNQAAVETNPAESALNPTETLRAFDQASRKKDAEAVKRYLSKGTLDWLNEQNQTVDGILKENDDLPLDEVPEMRNEKIEGDQATVEVENFLGEYDVFHLVKENGVWKLALDVMALEYKKRKSEEMNELPQNSSEKPKANKP